MFLKRSGFKTVISAGIAFTAVTAFGSIFWKGLPQGQSSSIKITHPQWKYQFQEGISEHYSLYYLTSGKSGLMAGLGIVSHGQLPQDSSLLLEGELIQTGLSASDEQLVLLECWIHPKNLRITWNQGVLATQSEVLKQDLSRPFYVEMNSFGKIERIIFHRETRSFSRSLLRSLISLIQVQLPSPDASTRWVTHQIWETQEENPNGSYLAQYERTLSHQKKEQFLDFKKFRKEYRPSDSLVSKQVIRSSTDIQMHFDPTLGRVLSIQGSDQEDIFLGSHQVGDQFAEIRLEHLKSSIRSTPPARPLFGKSSHFLMSNLQGTDDREALERSSKKAILGKDTWATLSRKLETLSQQQGLFTTGAEATELFSKLKALLYLYPSEAENLAKYLMDIEANSHEFRMLVGALGAVGTAEAERALCHLLDRRRADWPAASALIPVLGMLQNPSLSSESLLKELANRPPQESSHTGEIRMMSELSIGVMGRSLGPQNPRSSAILNDTLTALEHAPTDSERSLYLSKLGNLGSDGQLQVLKAYLKNPSAELRARAVSALRFVPSIEAEALLRSVLLNEPAETVRAQAAFALSFRKVNPETLNQERALLKKEPSASVAQALLKNLSTELRDHPEVIEDLKWYRDHGPHEDLQAYADSILLTVQTQ